jgi:predicted O-methyltransferase YrrM
VRSIISTKIYLCKVKYWFRIKSYLYHRIVSKNAHHLHSPFVYDFYTNILPDDRRYYAFEWIESLRNVFLQDQTSILVTDLGTGGVNANQRKLKVKFIAKHFLKPKRFGWLFFKMVLHYKPNRIIELGTSLGINTAYLASATNNTVYTVEGCEETLSQAKKGWQQLGIQNIKSVKGEAAFHLSEFLAHDGPFDLYYIDANHTSKALLTYYEIIAPHIHSKTILILDDIYWSSDMANGWHLLIDKKEVRISIDLYHIGILFFDPATPKQHFKLNCY